MTPIRLVLSKPTGSLPIGTSHFWGNPDLPEGTDYPMYIDSDGDEYPYVFICQLNMTEVAQFDKDNLLPHEGLLLFFSKIDRYLGNYDDTDCIGGSISGLEAVKVFYFQQPQNLRQVVLVDDDDRPLAPAGLKIDFSLHFPIFCDDHALLALPTHREWETWEHPYEDWEILLQIDSFSGGDFNLNFMDCGVLDFLIATKDLKNRDFNNVRAIVLST